MLEWLQKWYLDQCDGSWEHEYGIRIETLDNPGWKVTIDLAYTDIENIEIPHSLNEAGEDHWVGYSVEKKKFIGASSPSHLNDLLKVFKALWESNIEKHNNGDA
jgi:hypothetical protein